MFFLDAIFEKLFVDVGVDVEVDLDVDVEVEVDLDVFFCIVSPSVGNKSVSENSFIGS